MTPRDNIMILLRHAPSRAHAPCSAIMHFITRAESGENPRETFKCYVRCLLFIVLCTYLGTIYIKYNFSPSIISRCGPPAPCRPPAPETRGRRRRWRTRSPRPRLSREILPCILHYYCPPAGLLRAVCTRNLFPPGPSGPPTSTCTA